METQLGRGRRDDDAVDVIARDRRIKTELQAAGLEVASYNSALLREPWEVANKAGGPFQVFTTFWRHCLQLTDPDEPLPAPPRIVAPMSSGPMGALDRVCQ